MDVINKNTLDILIKNIRKMSVIDYKEKEKYYLEDDGDSVPYNIYSKLDNVFIKLPNNIEDEYYFNEIDIMIKDVKISNNDFDDNNYNIDNHKKLVSLYNKNCKYIKDITILDKTKKKVRKYYFWSVFTLLNKLYNTVSFDIENDIYNDINNYGKELIILLNVLVINTIKNINSNIDSLASFNNKKLTIDTLTQINNCFSIILYMMAKYK